MNKHLIALGSAMLITTALPTFAASTVDLTVKGLITPNACTPTLSNGGVVDLGKISAKDLAQESPGTTLPSVTRQMSINCDEKALFAINPVDNRPDTAWASTTDFGLGMINGTQKLGRFYLIPKNMVADGNNAQPISSADGGTTWYPGSHWALHTLWGVGAPGAGTALLAVKDLSMDLEVGTQIAPARILDLSDQQPIDGSGTLELKYL